MEFLRAENDANRRASRDDAEANRKLLLDSIKFVSIAVAALIGVAGIFGYRSVSDLKDTLETQARQATNAEIARMQVEIRQRLEEQFKTPELQKMVRSEADAAMQSAVTKAEKSVDPRLDELQRRISETGEISNAGARLRLGVRSGLDSLLEKAKSPNPYVSQYAKSTLTLIGADYDSFGQPNLYRVMLPSPQTPRNLLATMKSSTMVQVIAAAFGLFREITGSKVLTFDILAAEKWCADNPKKCDQAAPPAQNPTQK
jgi:hypothetical protein